MLTRSRQEVYGHASKGIWLANRIPPHQRFERFSGDSRRVQILFKFICGRIRTKVVQCVEQIVSRRTLKLIPTGWDYLRQSTRLKTHQRWGLWGGCICFWVIAGLVVLRFCYLIIIWTIFHFNVIRVLPPSLFFVIAHSAIHAFPISWLVVYVTHSIYLFPCTCISTNSCTYIPDDTCTSIDS